MRRLPALYAILDAQAAARRGIPLTKFAEELVAGGVQLLQYRDKSADEEAILRNAIAIGRSIAGSGCRLVLNDDPALSVQAGFDGVHVGQEDLSPAEARALVGAERMIGVSTHTGEQVREAETGAADYVAIGPVFATGSKENHDPVVGLDGVRRARGLTGKPLVAIGGITIENAAAVIEAGADSVAVISGLLAGSSIASMARRLLEVLPER